MSVVAGIFKFDRRDRVRPDELADLTSRIARLGPDGGRDFVDRQVGLSYRAFHTTPESHLEAQPLVQGGCVLTWDGRLDNREEIRKQTQIDSGLEATDADLVLTAYLNKGTNCFRDLIGDWALALWDQTRLQLILARDAMGVRRLFYRVEEDRVAWCTAIEPLVLTASGRLHPDLEYLAGCIYPHPPIESTAFREIRSVAPASFLMFKLGGRQSHERYWSLNPHGKIAYATDREYEEQFLHLFRESVRRRMRSGRTILAELSGGVDSSSIVCMADQIRLEQVGPRVETLSYFDEDEPSGDERPYFELIERARGRAGHRISITEFNQRFAGEALEPLPNDFFSASPGYTARSLRWASAIKEVLSASGARVVLSGVGGDEMLGGIQYEAPELADHLMAGRFVSFFKSALDWAVARQKPIYSLFADALVLAASRYRPDLLRSETGKPFAWALLGAPKRDRVFHEFSDWWRLSPTPLLMESVRFVLAQQLTSTDPPLTGCLEKRYPYLDRQLFEFLASIPRSQVLRAGHRRYLMRRALRGLVPDEVLLRKTKWFGYRSPAAVLNAAQEGLEAVFKEPWLTDELVVNTKLVWEHLQSVQHGRSDEAIALRSAIAVEQWLRVQVRSGIFDGEFRASGRTPAFESAATSA